MIVDCERVVTNEVAIFGYDTGVTRRVLKMTNRESISHEVLGGSIKLEVMKLEVSKLGAMKLGATWHHLPN